MTLYRARPGQVAYGYAIGMLCAEWHIPFIPGDLNNAGTFPFPVRYLAVSGVIGSGVLDGSGADRRFGEALGEAAQQLEAEGVRAITGNCGFMAAYQEHVAKQVRVPVFLSSLLQAPMLASMLSSTSRLGVLTANASGLTQEIFAAVGVQDLSRLAVQGLEEYDHFHDAILKETGELDNERMRAEVIDAARDLVRRDPSVAALLLECSDLPAYSRDVHEATGLPVFDWASYINYVYHAVVPRRYDGIF